VEKEIKSVALRGRKSLKERKERFGRNKKSTPDRKTRTRGTPEKKTIGGEEVERTYVLLLKSNTL